MIRHQSCLTREQTLSFGIVEFASRVARDNQATNVMEIKAEGWAFGQISDMREWVDSLYTSNKITAPVTVTVTVTVTGYSLGGHLASAFNLMYPGDAARTVTFNGAGIGTFNIDDAAQGAGQPVRGAIHAGLFLADRERRPA